MIENPSFLGGAEKVGGGILEMLKSLAQAFFGIFRRD